jgi:Holliday junction resolvase RusA-like endonuclease
VDGNVVIDFTVPGVARGKGRPRFVRATGRTYTDKPTVEAEQAVVDAWEEAGGVRLKDGPCKLELMVVMERPKVHWCKNGTLSKAGSRSGWPVRKPDLDNIQKLVCDALNGHAYKDDSQVVHVVAWKRWANAEEPAHTWVRLFPLTLPSIVRAPA